MTLAQGPLHLRALLSEVDTARAELRLARSSAEPKRAEVLRAQRKFRSALERYATAAQLQGFALPHRLRVELVVYRCLDD